MSDTQAEVLELLNKIMEAELLRRKGQQMRDDALTRLTEIQKNCDHIMVSWSNERTLPGRFTKLCPKCLLGGCSTIHFE